MTKFLSNSANVLKALPRSKVSASAIMAIDVENVEKLERALGIMWDTATDKFMFVAKLKENKPTKRGILSTASSLFDPLGFLLPFLIVARMLLQELWRLDLDWDQQIEGKLLDVWNK